MAKSVLNVVLAATIGLGATTLSGAQAPSGETIAQQPMPVPAIQREHLFEERAGTWKATCDEMEDRKIFCRMFHIEQFGEWKAKNFVQLGPAWTPDSVGFVVATYLGFKEGTKVTIGIDKHERYELTAPRGNNLMISPEVTQKILGEMEGGNRIVVYFHSYSGVRQLSLADLGPYNSLLSKVKVQMAKNNRPEGVQ